VCEHIKNEANWRDGTIDDIQAFVENGIGRVERARVFHTAVCTEAPAMVSRGKGKKRKPWEAKYGH
jgi:hypothetical protein